MKKVPIMIIASRRQIDIKDFKEGMLTIGILEILVNLLKKKIKIILLLSVGIRGPLQNNIEIKKLNISEAMRSAKSYMEDIDSDFKIIHIDTSLSLKGVENNKKSIKKTFELYKFCNDYAKRKIKKFFLKLYRRAIWDNQHSKRINETPKKL